MEGFAITPCPGEGFGVSGVQQGPRGGRKGQIPPPGSGSTQSHACGVEHVWQCGGGHGEGAGHIAELTGTRTAARVGGRWE